MNYVATRQDGEPPYYLKVMRGPTRLDYDSFECGRHIKVRCHKPHTVTITDTANGIDVELPRDGHTVYHEDRHGTTIDTIQPLTPLKGEK